eukprot:s10431_g1.t1
MSLAASKRTKPSKTPLVLQTLVPVFPTYLNTQGFGFVTRSDGADFFMHIKSVVDGSIPQQGDLVRFDVEENPLKPGEMQACNVSP